jgi:Met-zincin
MYNQVSGQFGRYMGHVSRHVGGIHKTPKMVEESGPVFEITPKAKQKESVDFLNKQLFATPSWLINTEIFSKTGQTGLSVIGSLQDNILNNLLAGRTLNKLVDAESALGNKAYTVQELLGDLKKGIWTELSPAKSIDVYRRSLQKSYVNVLSSLINPPRSTAVSIPGFTFTSSSGSEKSDYISVVRAHLESLRREINTASVSIPDAMTKYHLLDVSKRIDKALNPKD